MAKKKPTDKQRVSRRRRVFTRTGMLVGRADVVKSKLEKALYVYPIQARFSLLDRTKQVVGKVLSFLKII